jgi:hypothetical protein
MKKIVTFINWHQYGDLYHLRGMLSWIVRHLQETDIECNFLHNCDNLPQLVDGVSFSHFRPHHNREEIFSHTYTGVRGVHELIINTWIASYPNFCGTFDCINATTLHEQAIYIINIINFTYGINIPHPEVVDIIPTTPTNLPNISAVGELLKLTKKYKKRVLLCNGPVHSSQTPQFSIAEKIKTVVNEHKDCAFIYTEKDPAIQLDNEFVIDDIIPRNNLNEIIYISTFCDVLVSRMSGPGCAICTRENFFNQDVSFICLTDNQNLAHWYKNGTCKYDWTNDYSDKSIIEIIKKHLS